MPEIPPFIPGHSRPDRQLLHDLAWVADREAKILDQSVSYLGFPEGLPLPGSPIHKIRDQIVSYLVQRGNDLPEACKSGTCDHPKGTRSD